jgi:hypothetical protein
MSLKEIFLLQTEVILSDIGMLRADRISIHLSLVRIMAGSRIGTAA